jgi:hypothetical protein
MNGYYALTRLVEIWASTRAALSSAPGYYVAPLQGKEL